MISTLPWAFSWNRSSPWLFTQWQIFKSPTSSAQPENCRWTDLPPEPRSHWCPLKSPYREAAGPWEVVDPIWKKWTRWGQRSTTWWMVSKLFHQQPGHLATFLLVTSLWRWTMTFEEHLSQLHSATRLSPFSSIPCWILVFYLVEWKKSPIVFAYPPTREVLMLNHGRGRALQRGVQCALKATVSDLVMGIGALLEKHRFLRYPGDRRGREREDEFWIQSCHSRSVLGLASHQPNTVTRHSARES